MDQSTLYQLLDRWLDHSLDEQGETSLQRELADPANAESIKDYLDKRWEQYKGEEQPEDSEALYQSILQEIRPHKVISLWKKLAVAASVIAIICIGGYLAFFNKPSTPPVIAKASIHDVEAPATNRARIMLADSSFIYVDSMADGQLVTEKNMQLMKLGDGQIVYKGNSTGLIYNTLSNPSGSKPIMMTLSDGSQVWLNAGSAVTYPIAFNGNERNVTVTGEAYFEVTHDAAKPFIVTAGETKVQVLGTHFNVNAHADEPDQKITLLEGSVKVNHQDEVSFLKPGQQAKVGVKVDVVNDADLEQVMAWKNGIFKFNGSDIQTVMREAARWYNITVSYPNGVPTDTFKGTLFRTINLSQFLKILSISDVKATIDGQHVTIEK